MYICCLDCSLSQCNVQVDFLSDPSVNFGHTAFPSVNYLDPNYNIAIPVFSVHGNHDDPAGQGNFSSMDLLHACGLINYFGKCLSLEAVELSPLLMEKGATRLALYGLGAMKDERLHRCVITFSVSYSVVAIRTAGLQKITGVCSVCQFSNSE